MWDKYGLILTIPPNALPDGCSHCNLKIAVSHSGDFELPEDCVLVSEVYSLTHDLGDRKLRKSATLKVQHCGTTEALSDLKILRGNNHSNKFAVIPDGDFSPNDHYGVIELDHSCFICVGWIRPYIDSVFPQRYCARLYYTDIEERSFILNFFIVPHLNSNFTVCN